ncbi:MAG: ABC transporter permease [Chloroflexota bacterium]
MIDSTTTGERSARGGARWLDFRARSVAGVWMRHFIAFRRGWMIETTGVILEPVMVLAALAFGIGGLVGEVNNEISYAVFVAPGVVIGNAMFHSLFECSWGAFRRLQTNRIYDSILAAPVSMFELAMGEIVWGATRSLMTTVAVMVFAVAFGLLESPLGILMLAVGFATGLMFGAVGLVFAAVAPTTHALMLVFTVFATPLFFFTGAFFPIETLPDWLEPFAWALPLAHPIHISRGLATGDLSVTHLYSLAYMIVVTIAFFPVATYLLKRRLLV